MITLDTLLSPFDPNVGQYLSNRAGVNELKLIESRKHWAAYVWPMFRVLVGEAGFIWSMTLEHWWSFWPVWLVSMTILAQACYQIVDMYRDRFVVSTLKVFRVHGVFATGRDLVPVMRLTELSVQETLTGKLLGYGHFRCETAGRDPRGLTDVTFVKDINRRAEIINLLLAQAPALELVDMGDGG